MSSASRVDDQDMVARAVLATDNLYLLRDTYFPENPDEKISKLRREADLALKLLDSIPSGAYSSVLILLLFYRPIDFLVA